MSKFSSLSFEEILECINFSSLEVKFDGAGKQYVLHTHSYGSSPLFESIHEIRHWIENKLGWQIVNKCRE